MIEKDCDFKYFHLTLNNLKTCEIDFCLYDDDHLIFKTNIYYNGYISYEDLDGWVGVGSGESKPTSAPLSLENVNFLNLYSKFTEIMPRTPPPPPNKTKNKKTLYYSLKIFLDACMYFHHDCIYVLIEFYKDDI